MFLANVPFQYLAWCENKPKLTDLYPIMVGYEACKKDKEPFCKEKFYYTIHYVKSGCGYVTDNEGTHFVTKGKCFIARPGEALVYVPDHDNPWEYIWLGFSGKLASQFDTLPTVFDFNSSLFLEMLDASKEPALQEMLITSLLFKMYVFLFSKTQNDSSDIKSRHVKTVRRFIDYNFMHDFSIDEIAKKHNLNRNYLSQIFKEQVGTTMQEYRLKKRLTEAYELLSTGNSVTEVANMVGYNDISVFSRAFKKFHGFPPSEVKLKNK